jgi:VWFA-related protein
MAVNQPAAINTVMLSKRKWIVTMGLLIVFCASRGAQEPADVIKVDIDLVTINVAVTEGKGRLVTNLKPEDFHLTDEGQQVALQFFDSKGPASIVFLIDISSSMRGKKWRSLKNAMKKFLAQAHEGDDYTLIAFSDRPQLIARSVTAEQFWRSLTGLQPFGPTALYDALMLGLDALERVPQRHRAIVLLTDGQDNCSNSNLADVQREASKHRATIYSVGLLQQQRDLSRWEQNGKDLLDELATVTGGLVQFPDPDEIHGVLDKINEDVRGQYCLSYYPPDKAAGWRHVRISLSAGPRPFSLRYQQRYLRKELGASVR